MNTDENLLMIFVNEKEAIKMLFDHWGQIRPWLFPQIHDVQPRHTQLTDVELPGMGQGCIQDSFEEINRDCWGVIEFPRILSVRHNGTASMPIQPLLYS